MSDCGTYSCVWVSVSYEWCVGDGQVAVAVHIAFDFDAAFDRHRLPVEIRARFRRGGEGQRTGYRQPAGLCGGYRLR